MELERLLRNSTGLLVNVEGLVRNSWPDSTPEEIFSMAIASFPGTRSLNGTRNREANPYVKAAN
jgi:hypothetical protein